MKRSVLRNIIILASLLIITIISTQFLFLKKASDFHEKVSDQNIQTALRRVYREITGNIDGREEREPVRQLSSNFFIVNLNYEIKPETLKQLLKKEFQAMGISEDFQFAVYDKKLKQLKMGYYISSGQPDRQALRVPVIPAYNYNNYYFCVYFPYKTGAILDEMGIWIFLSMILLLIVMFFIYSAYNILKQKKLSEIQKDFINNMTHEFQTPISTISISSEALRNTKLIESKERVINYATIIQEEAFRLQRQVDTILQVARIDNYTIKLNKEIINAHTYINNAAEKVLIYSCMEQDVFTFNLNAAVPYIDSDPVHFFNIVYNLLDNAVKYSKGTPDIEISTKNYNQKFELSISDKGIGMTAKEVKNIFKKFYRAAPSNGRNIKGFGIGLYYVNIITRAHQGKINVKTKPGEGTTFSLIFPVKEQQL